MNKIIRKNIGWRNNKFEENIFDESNNMWFVIMIDNIQDENIYESLKEDSRVFENEDLEVYFVHKDNIDDIEKEYNIEFTSIVDLLDIAYGDWEQDYDEIGKHFKIDERKAYEIVGDNISKVLGEMSIKINQMSREELKILKYDDLSKMEYSYFVKYIYKILLDQINFIKENCSDVL